MRASPHVTSGRVAEYRVVADLLERGYEVTLPVVDNGADCHVRVAGAWFSVQVKRCYRGWGTWGGGGKGRVIDADILALVLDQEVRYRSAICLVPQELL